MVESSFISDLRRFERYAHSTFVWYHLVGDHAPDVELPHGVARSCDVSREGVGLVVPSPLPVGNRIFLEVVAPMGKLSVVGLIMHCRLNDEQLYRAGVSIEILPPSDHMTLERILAP